MGNGDDGDDARRSSPPCPPVVAAQRVMDGKRVRVGCAPAPAPTHPGTSQGKGGEGLAGAAAWRGAKRADAGGAATILALGLPAALPLHSTPLPGLLPPPLPLRCHLSPPPC